MARRFLRTSLTAALLAVAAVAAPAARAATPAQSQQRAGAYLESIRHHPTRLRAFFLAMPKGGDLQSLRQATLSVSRRP